MNPEVSKDLLSKQVINPVFHVHKNLGPGLLESIYEECLVYTLKKRNLNFARQKARPLKFEDAIMESGLRLDLVVEDSIVLELKAVEKIFPVHRLSGLKTGFLINLNVPLIKDGIKRYTQSS